MCITGVEDTSGDLKESGSVEFHNGIIIPGFVNCHCHLELSHMEGMVSQGGGLGRFLENINKSRKTEHDIIVSAARKADEYMFREGVSLCGDICNTSSTFEIKKESRIKYINLIEVFGIDPEKASESNGRSNKSDGEVGGDEDSLVAGSPFCIFNVTYSDEAYKGKKFE